MPAVEVQGAEQVGPCRVQVIALGPVLSLPDQRVTGRAQIVGRHQDLVDLFFGSVGIVDRGRGQQVTSVTDRTTRCAQRGRGRFSHGGRSLSSGQERLSIPVGTSLSRNSGGSNGTEDGGVTLTASTTQAHGCGSSTPPLELEERGQGQPGAGHAHRVPEGDGARRSH